MASKTTEELSRPKSPIYIDMGFEMAVKLAHRRFTENTNDYLIPYIVSQPGTGKSSIFKDVLKKYGFGGFSVTIGLLPIEQLSGLPTISDSLTSVEREDGTWEEVKNKYTHWLAPELFYQIQQLSKDHEFSIVLFDDWHLAPASVQSYGFELFTDHKIHGYKMPNNVRFCAAGNASTLAGAKQSMSAIMNRMQIINVRPNRHEWINQYAEPNRLNPIVLSFLRNSANDGFFLEAEASTPHGTPRSWAGLANTFTAISDYIDLSKNTDIFTALAEGAVSHQAAAQLTNFYLVYSKVPVVEIFEKSGKMPRSSSNADRYPVIIACTEYVKSKIMDFIEKNNDPRQVSKPSEQDNIKQLKEIKRIIDIYTKIVMDYKESGLTELASLAIMTLASKHNRVQIGADSVTMFDVISQWANNNLIPNSILHYITQDMTGKTRTVSNLSERYNKVNNK
jgi:hypothetical protein